MAKTKFIDKFGEDSSDNRHYIQLTEEQVQELQHIVGLALQIQTKPHSFSELNREFNNAKHAFMAAIAEELKLHYSYVGKRLEQLHMVSNPYSISELKDLLVIQGNEPAKWTANIYLILPADEPIEEPTAEALKPEPKTLYGVVEALPDEEATVMNPMENEAPFVLVDGFSLITLPVNYKGFIQCPWYASIVPCDPSTMSYRVVLWKNVDYGEIEIAEHTHLVHGETFSDVQVQAATVLNAHLEQLGYLLLMGEVPAINGDLDRQFGDAVLLGYHRDVVEAYSDA